MNTTDSSEYLPQTAQLEPWTLVVAVNNEQVLKSTLLASPAIDGRCRVIAKKSFSSAGRAYNQALKEATTDLVVFSHQDVYLPIDWPTRLATAIDRLDRAGGKWGVLGLFGMSKDGGKPYGHCYSTGLGRTLGVPFHDIVPAESLDEFVLVIRKSSGLNFDEQLPGFHLYSTDLCLSAEEKGLRNYIISAFCVHNSNGVKRFPIAFWRAYLYMRRKWAKRLPIVTCCTTISSDCVPLIRQVISDLRGFVRGSSVGSRSENVAELYGRIRSDISRN